MKFSYRMLCALRSERVYVRELRGKCEAQGRHDDAYSCSVRLERLCAAMDRLQDRLDRTM
jgi:hypothetical protein